MIKDQSGNRSFPVTLFYAWGIILPIVVSIVCAFGVIFYFYYRSKKGSGVNWSQFNAKAKGAGFSPKEAELLRNLALQCDLKDPYSLFSSQSQLDLCLSSLIKAVNKSGALDNLETQAFLSRLFDYRKKIEMNRSSSGDNIVTTRQIEEGQSLKILVPGVGIYFSQVVNNTTQFMTISRPVNSKNAPTISWNKVKISVYFQREDDAGYVFDTEVMDEVLSKGVLALKIPHCESLSRTQKRKSKRIKMNKAAYMYLVSPTEPPHTIESEPGLKCFMEDLSDTGCAFTVGGKAESGMRVKVQFGIGSKAVCMSGIVRSTSYKEDTNRSVIRMEADPLPISARIIILGEVFSISANADEEELPYRVLDNEAAQFAEQNAPGMAAHFGGNSSAVNAGAASDRSLDFELNDLSPDDDFAKNNNSYNG